MPNYCENSAYISHPNKKKLACLEKAFKKGKLMQEFVPCPQVLLDTVAGAFTDVDKQKALEKKEKANIKKYGVANWYDWCIKNWGTKWDVGGEACYFSAQTDGSVHIRFDSAWSPPIAFYEKMRDAGFSIKAYFVEYGCCFAGIWDNGESADFEDWKDAEDAERMLPRDLDEEFDIVSNLSELEEE